MHTLQLLQQGRAWSILQRAGIWPLGCSIHAGMEYADRDHTVLLGLYGLCSQRSEMHDMNRVHCYSLLQLACI